MPPESRLTTDERKALLKAQRIIEESSDPTDASSAPNVSREGPDPHVLAGRRERAAAKDKRVAGVPGATIGMSEADITKREQQLQPRRPGDALPMDTPGLDAFKRSNGMSGPPTSSVRPGAMQSAVANAANQYRAETAPALPDAYARDVRPSVMDRVKKVAPHLKPGESYGITEDDEIAGARRLKPGQTQEPAEPGVTFGTSDRTVSTDGELQIEGYKAPAGQKIAVGPGLVGNDAGKMVPIGPETARIGKPFEDARTRAQANAEKNAAYMQGVVDNNPSVMAKRAADAYSAQRAREYATERTNLERERMINEARKSPSYNPSREQMDAQRLPIKTALPESDIYKPIVTRQPRAKKIVGS